MTQKVQQHTVLAQLPGNTLTPGTEDNGAMRPLQQCLSHLLYPSTCELEFPTGEAYQEEFAHYKKNDPYIKITHFDSQNS